MARIRGDANDVDYRVDGDNDVNINYIDLRYAGWKPWAGAWTEVGIDYAMPNPTNKQKEYGGLYEADNGVMVTGEISQTCWAAITSWCCSMPTKVWRRTWFPVGRLVRHVELCERCQRLPRD